MSKIKTIASNSAKWPVIGHSKIVDYLQHCLDTSQLAHAYLLVGPAQVGKTTVARFLVDELVYGKTTPLFASSDPSTPRFHPDIHWLDREMNEKTSKLKKNISVEQVRQLQNKLSLHSFLNTKKVGVVASAQNLSLEAANSLLKTLEEPTPNTILILIAEDISYLPQTIVSRCQVLKFLPVASQEIFDHLLTLKIERKKAKHIAQMSFGRPGLALGFTENSEAYAERLAAGRNFLFLLKASTVDRFKAVDELVKNSALEDLYQTLNLWQSFLRDVMLTKYMSENFIAHASLHADITKLTAVYGRGSVLQLFKQLNQTKVYLKANVNPRLAFENLILNF